MLPRAVVESVHKLDVIIGNKASYREVFKPENISLRNKYVHFSELCERERKEAGVERERLRLHAV